MATEYKKAQLGDAKAQSALFDSARQKIWVLSRSLLLEDTVAESVFLAVFKEAGPLLADSAIADEAAFTHRLVIDVITRCRRHVSQSGQSVFRIPKQGAVLKTADLPKGPYTDHGLENFLLCLPPLQRFCFVLRYGAGMESAEIAGLMDLREAEIKTLTDAEPETLSHIYNLLRQSKARCVPPTTPLLQDAFAMAETSSPIPEATENLAREAFLQNAPKPQRKKPGLWFKVFVISLVVMLLAGAIAIVTINQKAKEIQAEADARTTETVTEETTTGKTASDESSDNAEAEPEATDNALHEITVPEATEAPADAETDSAATDSAAVTTYADIAIQDYGTITVQLDAEAAPLTVANFIKLAQSGFYDGLTFHRIIDGFMMQGGDPNGDGTGGSDETITGEFSENGWDNPLSHTRGAISMARSTDPDSASSQFFIVQSDSTYLDGSYAVFGYVTEGMDIVDRICADAQPTDTNGSIPADEQPVITSIVIREVSTEEAGTEAAG